ncbi:hypothetical protein SRHO_G00206920 [Serrasalmus rhombeus]
MVMMNLLSCQDRSWRRTVAANGKKRREKKGREEKRREAPRAPSSATARGCARTRRSLPLSRSVRPVSGEGAALCWASTKCIKPPKQQLTGRIEELRLIAE